MKPAPFEHHEPRTVDEAADLLAGLGDEAKVLAGGQSLLPLLGLRLARVGHLVDINRIADLDVVTANGNLELGATVRHRTAERSPVVQTSAPLLAAALGYVGHAAIRNRGTVAGSIAHADPAAEVPAVMLALDGSLVATSRRGVREIEAADLFAGFLTTTLEPDELVTAIRFPISSGRGWSVQEFSRRSGDFAVVGAAVALGIVDGRVDTPRVAMFGVGDRPLRVATAESVLAGAPPSASLWEEAAAQVPADIAPSSDLHGTAAYRRHLARVLVRRALEEAASRVDAAA